MEQDVEKTTIGGHSPPPSAEEASFSDVLHQLVDCLMATDGADYLRLDVQFLLRMQRLLTKMLDLITSTAKDSVRNVRDVVALLKQLCQVVPNIFDHGGKCLEALILLKLASLFTHPKLEGIHEDIGNVSASVLELFCHRDFEGFNAFFQDVLLLMQDLSEVWMIHQRRARTTEDEALCIVAFSSFLSAYPETGLAGSTDGKAAKYIVSVKDASECALMQRCLLVTITRLVDAMPQFLTGHSNSLWNVLLQLQQGAVFLTLDVLRMYYALLMKLPPPTMCEQSLRYLMALLVVDKSIDPLAPRNEVLDAELSRCLEALLFQIKPFLIRPYAPRLMDSVIPSNLSRTTNVRLKIMLCRLFACCMNACPSNVQSVMRLLPYVHHCCIREHLRRCFRIYAKITLAEQQSAPTPRSTPASSSSHSRKRLHFNDPPAETESKHKLKASLQPLFMLAEVIPLSESPATSTSTSTSTSVSSLTDGIHSLDLILRTCSIAAHEDPIAFKQLLTKLHRAIGSVVSLLQRYESEERIQVLQCALILAELSADLLQMLSNHELFSGFLESFLCLASLPWTSEDDKAPKPCDLSRYPLRLVISCLRLLCWLPNSFAPKTRKDIINSSLHHKHLNIRLHSLLLLPLFTHRLARPNIMKLLSVLRDLLDDESTEIVGMLGKQLGLLACLGSNDLGRPPRRKASALELLELENSLPCHHTQLDELPEEIFHDLLEQINLQCKVCDQISTGERKDETPARKKPRTVIEDGEGSGDEAKSTDKLSVTAWLPFLEYLLDQSADELVRVEFARSLRRILAHRPSGEDIQDNVRPVLLSCFRLVFDPSVSVRLRIAEALPYFVAEGGLMSIFDGDVNSPTQLESMLNDLKKALDDDNDPNGLQETSLTALGHLGSVLQGRFQLDVVITLLRKLAHPNVSLRTIIYEQLNKAAGKMSLPQLMEHYKYDTYPVIIGTFISSRELLAELSGTIFDMETEQFLRHTLSFTLPRIVMEGSHSLLKELARKLRTSLPQLLVPNMHHIFCHVLVEGTPKQLEDSFHFFSTLLPQWSKPAILLKSCTNKLLDQLTLLLAYPDKQPKVETAFLTIRRILKEDNEDDGDHMDVEQNDHAAQISDFLRSYFLGIMDFLLVLLHKGKQSTQPEADDMDRILRSLAVLIRLIGPHLNTFRPKVMATLKLVLKFPQLVVPACKVWFDFLKRLDVGQLGPILSQIVVDLLPYVSTATQEVVHIFEFLIIENKAALHPHFNKILFLPDLPPLARVRRELEHYQSKDWKEQLAQLLKEGINHESLDVQLLALDKLQKILADCREELAELIMADAVSSLVVDLMKGLMLCARTTSKELRVKIASCLGELGAIDPERLDLDVKSELHRLASSSNTGKPLEHEDDDELAFQLISSHLLPAFRAARDTRGQDRAAFAIQEVLKLCGCNEQTPVILAERRAAKEAAASKGRKRKSQKNLPSDVKRGVRFWRRFDEDVRELMRPFLSSQYVLQALSTQPKVPIYPTCKDYHAWISTWAAGLIQRAKGPQADLFLTCRGIVKDDLNVAHFLLPYLVLCVLRFGSEDDSASICAEVLAVLEDPLSGKSPAKSERNLDERSQMNTATIFSLLDLLNKWLEVQQAANPRPNARSRTGGRSSSRSSGSKSKSSDVERVEQLMAQIPQLTLAKASFRCRAYPRALQHFELHLRKEIDNDPIRSGDVLGANATMMQKIYMGLDEPDGLKGIATFRKSTTLRDHILDFENSGKWRDAFMCYDQALQIHSQDDFSYQVGRFNCLLNLGQLETMLNLATSQMASHAQKRYEHVLMSYGVQAAWRLGKWDVLHKFLSPHLRSLTEETSTAPVVTPGSSVEQDMPMDFEVAIGGLVSTIKRQDDVIFQKLLHKTRAEVMGVLSAASTESYHRAYPYLVKLHMLNEIEQSFNLGTVGERGKDIIASWDKRLRRTQPSFKAREPILNLRRAILDLHDMPDEANNCLLQMAKVARTAGQYQTASAFVLRASTSNQQGLKFHLESARLRWAQGEQHQALLQLQRALSIHAPDLPKKRSARTEVPAAAGDPVLAKAFLLAARWTQLTGQSAYNDVKEQYDTVTTIQPKWEKALFFLAQYWDGLVTECRRQHQETAFLDSAFLSMLPYVINNYGGSLQCGHRYIFQSMPRMLTLWLDFGADVARHQKDRNDEKMKNAARTLEGIHKSIARVIKKAATYQWYLCYPQIISRIGHRHNDVYALLEEIILQVLVTYPQQAMWSMIALFHSRMTIRKKRAIAIFIKAKERSQKLKEQLTCAEKFCNYLLEISDFNVPKTTNTWYLSKSTLQQPELSSNQLIVPLQNQLTAILPSSDQIDHTYDPFPESQVYVDSLLDKVEIMGSLQRPKKITMIGSDGKEYLFLCKPKDDLRKDCRMMEFNTMINKLLKKNPETRRRKLRIRTYAVVPLNEECGLIEWVPNTTGFRHILNAIYNAEGLGLPTKQLRETWGSTKLTPLEIYRDHVLPMYPPVFHKWFLKSFPDPLTWFEARLAYARAIAVMSMVGYVVGLGDRHGENILFDSTTGECVHVDFNCLFWRGLTFEKPEKVPFRLTPNMTDALGLTKYEGVYRSVCELTLRVLRDNKDTLMSVLETFIYDPLVEWTSKHRSAAAATGEVNNESAVQTVADIERKLRGQEKSFVTLSVEGQVHSQIMEAISQENLSKMYIGWAPWM